MKLSAILGLATLMLSPALATTLVHHEARKWIFHLSTGGFIQSNRLTFNQPATLRHNQTCHSYSDGQQMAEPGEDSVFVDERQELLFFSYELWGTSHPHVYRTKPVVDTEVNGRMPGSDLFDVSSGAKGGTCTTVWRESGIYCRPPGEVDPVEITYGIECTVDNWVPAS